MAEERLIDDDKDRKFRIRKNADGEDELYMVEGDEEEEKESIEFEVPEFETDDEEAAVLTPEQFAERERLKREEEARNRVKCDELLSRARQLIDEQSYEGALYCISEAEELIENDGQVAVVKLLAVTENLRSFSGEEVASAVDGVENNCNKEQLAELSERLDNLNGQAGTLSKEVEKLQSVNEEKKAQRRSVFLKKKKNSLIFFTATVVPFLVFLILGIYFSTVMHAVKDGRNIVLTFVFFGVAGALFIAFLFAAHMLWDSAKKVSLNEKNSSTQIGREFEGKKKQLSLIERVITAIKEEENTALGKEVENKAVENDLS
ncbi:MAG: hypothetical protein J1G05_00070 [Clostridiales bacterium]|nr:hypothetical protein [Clostridiales bacterium]